MKADAIPPPALIAPVGAGETAIDAASPAGRRPMRWGSLAMRGRAREEPMPIFPLDSAAHVVQLALTPIFLLTGIASLLNVFTTRLGRVADKVDQLARDRDAHPRQLRQLQLRSHVLDVAVVFAALAGGLTCCAALTLFFSALREASGGRLLFGLFGGSLACAVLALFAFVLETILSGRTVREQAEASVEGAGPPR